MSAPQSVEKVQGQHEQQDEGESSFCLAAYTGSDDSSADKTRETRLSPEEQREQDESERKRQEATQAEAARACTQQEQSGKTAAAPSATAADEDDDEDNDEVEVFRKPAGSSDRT
ncbi:hypothetical protein C6P46_000878 [Rhodotorula mucilaginosa]|uniref:Uncharacterized protein n=1 Tax=Rhodotorula mucilaginosa TaxID=5537 RepID=A0A9P7B2X9_RHOMI|nr:hypothetical protein C6P46_000878 [Rhodotorula mucilaginosa]